MEQQLRTAAGERRVSELVEHHEIDPGKLIGQPASVAVEALSCQPIDQVDDVKEPTVGVGTDADRSDGGHQVGLLRVPVPPTKTTLR